MRYLRSPVIWCPVCQGPHHCSPRLGCRGCRRRQAKQREVEAQDTSTWTVCPRCNLRAPPRLRPGAMCTTCRKQLYAERKALQAPGERSPYGPRPREDFVSLAPPTQEERLRQERQAKRQARKALRQWRAPLYPAALAALAQNRVDLMKAREADTAARQAWKQARADKAALYARAVLGDPAAREALPAARERTRLALQASHAAKAAVQEARARSRAGSRYYALLCHTHVPLDPTA